MRSNVTIIGEPEDVVYLGAEEIKALLYGKTLAVQVNGQTFYVATYENLATLGLRFD